MDIRTRAEAPAALPRTPARPGALLRALPRAPLPWLLLAAFAAVHAALLPYWVFSGDSYRYATAALGFLGAGPAEAHRAALEAWCGAQHAVPYASCLADVPEGLRALDPRYERIFTTRPGYPLLAAPAVALLGVVPGMWLTGLLLGAAGGLLTHRVLREAGAGRGAAAVGTGLFLFGAPGYWSVRPLTEGALFVGALAVVLGARRVLAGRPGGLAVVAGALAGLVAVKYSTALLVGAALAVAGLAGRSRRLAALGLGTAGAVATGTWALGLPGASVAAQDLLTGHFARPDVADPWPRMAGLAVRFWLDWGRDETAFAVLLALAAAALWRADRRLALPALAVAAAGAGAATALPGAAELDRLWVLMWVPVVLGVPWVVAGVRRAAPGDDPGARDTYGPERRASPVKVGRS
ncbi:hypothetical protein ABT160_44165 [Streptomyces sp. NPDC001941]|uniref:hypothetical protein n=1 Tax=Streptomyces sp. NPDC001941 TaxID=3154659 RepID=UPI0033236597